MDSLHINNMHDLFDMTTAHALGTDGIIDRHLHHMRRQLQLQMPPLDIAALNGALLEAQRTITRCLEQQYVDVPALDHNPADRTIRCLATHTSQSHSPFLQLPPELRNRIYEFVILDHDGENTANKLCVQDSRIDVYPLGMFRYGNHDHDELGCAWANAWDMDCDYFAQPLHAMPPSIAQVCRQMRAETLPIFYGQKVFVAYYNPHSYQIPMVCAKRWLDHIGKRQFGLIRQFRIRVSLTSIPVPVGMRNVDCQNCESPNLDEVFRMVGLGDSGLTQDAMFAEVGLNVRGVDGHSDQVSDYDRVHNLDWKLVPRD